MSPCGSCASAADSLLVALGIGKAERGGLTADRRAWHRAFAALHRRHEAGWAEAAPAAAGHATLPGRKHS